MDKIPTNHLCILVPALISCTLLALIFCKLNILFDEKINITEFFKKAPWIAIHHIQCPVCAFFGSDRAQI